MYQDWEWSLEEEKNTWKAGKETAEQSEPQAVGGTENPQRKIGICAFLGHYISNASIILLFNILHVFYFIKIMYYECWNKLIEFWVEIKHVFCNRNFL